MARKTKIKTDTARTAPVQQVQSISLADQLSKPVAAVFIKPIIEPEAGETAEPGLDFIDVQPEPEPQPMRVLSSNQQYQQFQDQPSPDEPKNLSPDDLAIIAVNVFDGLQQFGLAMLSKSMMLNADERELLTTLDTSEKVIYPEGSKDAIAMAKYRKHLAMVKELPFKPDEKQRLQDAGIIYARTLDLKVTPLQGIMMALTEVMGTRASKIIMGAI
jgi:hypothetical protein